MPKGRGVSVVNEQVKKYELMKDSIIDFLRERDVYEGTIKSLSKELGYTRPYQSVFYTDVTNAFFILTLYALISEKYVVCEEPDKLSKKYP